MSKNKIQITIISILTIIFFTLMFLSTTKSGITTNYNFKDEITINNINNQATSTIGQVDIENQGFLTKRVKLNNYVLCILNENIVDKTFEIYYTGGKTNPTQQDMFFNYNQRSIDVSSNQKTQLEMNINRYNYELESYIKQYDLFNKTVDMYIFEVTDINSDNYYNYYSYCNQVNKEDSVKTIKVKFELTKEDLNNIKIVPREIPIY